MGQLASTGFNLYSHTLRRVGRGPRRPLPLQLREVHLDVRALRQRRRRADAPPRRHSNPHATGRSGTHSTTHAAVSSVAVVVVEKVVVAFFVLGALVDGFRRLASVRGGGGRSRRRPRWRRRGCRLCDGAHLQVHLLRLLFCGVCVPAVLGRLVFLVFSFGRRRKRTSSRPRCRLAGQPDLELDDRKLLLFQRQSFPLLFLGSHKH